MALSDDVKAAAQKIADQLKKALRSDRFDETSETMDEVSAGSPQTPGHEADYGKTMKARPLWPDAPREPEPPSRDRDAGDIDR